MLSLQHHPLMTGAFRAAVMVVVLLMAAVSAEACASRLAKAHAVDAVDAVSPVVVPVEAAVVDRAASLRTAVDVVTVSRADQSSDHAIDHGRCDCSCHVIAALPDLPSIGHPRPARLASSWPLSLVAQHYRAGLHRPPITSVRT
jgi:hypothetical protein